MVLSYDVNKVEESYYTSAMRFSIASQSMKLMTLPPSLTDSMLTPSKSSMSTKSVYSFM